ncbi:CLUMA_CG005000, isoform A [Clunio marinus]|uniref:CLUMA_CG005000, isoform A n=1 Tax=Clunio marinus TaxID=568069 RepID=A0A1J1HXS8_9DIPT|nr:CLUMA_CG005000, isoform A [Clunio marinus]
MTEQNVLRSSSDRFLICFILLDFQDGYNNIASDTGNGIRHIKASRRMTEKTSIPFISYNETSNSEFFYSEAFALKYKLFPHSTLGISSTLSKLCRFN